MGPRARDAQREARARVRIFRLSVLAIAAGLTIGGIALALTALPAFIIIYGGMLPTMVAFLVDDRPGRYLFRTIGVTNAAGVIPFLLASFQFTSNAGIVISPVGRFDTWLTIYGAAIGGWLLVIGVPIVWQMGFEVVLEFRMRRYEEAREELAKEWDLQEPQA
jgi:hypothetical protein